MIQACACFFRGGGGFGVEAAPAIASRRRCSMPWDCWLNAARPCSMPVTEVCVSLSDFAVSRCWCCKVRISWETSWRNLSVMATRFCMSLASHSWMRSSTTCWTRVGQAPDCPKIGPECVLLGGGTLHGGRNDVGIHPHCLTRRRRPLGTT